MAKKNKIGLRFDGWEEYISKLDKMAGGVTTKRTVEKALIESKKIVNEKIEAAMQPSNLPAKGNYSTGRTLQSLDKDESVTWSGDTANIPIGFNLKESGMTSIYLMYGTPTMQPAKGLKSAIYGSAVKKQVAKKQEEIIKKALEET